MGLIILTVKEDISEYLYFLNVCLKFQLIINGYTK